MNREFEYYALRQAVDNIFRIYRLYGKCEFTVWANKQGIECRRSGEGILVYPMSSPRKRPACVLLMPDAQEVNMDWNACMNRDGRYAYVYAAGTITVAGAGEIIEVRPKAEDTALHFRC